MKEEIIFVTSLILHLLGYSKVLVECQLDVFVRRCRLRWYS